MANKGLNDDLILKICEMIEAGIAKQKIADELGVSYATVYRYGTEFGLIKSKPKKTKTNNAKKKDSEPVNTRGG